MVSVRAAGLRCNLSPCNVFLVSNTVTEKDETMATETKIERLTRAANGGGIAANQILGCVFAAPVLVRKAVLVQRRLDKAAAGRVASNTDAEYAQIISHQIGQLADTMQYNNPDAAHFAQQNVVRAFHTGGLVAVKAEILKLADRAARQAELAQG
jgi:hypothetical protein